MKPHQTRILVISERPDLVWIPRLAICAAMLVSLRSGLQAAESEPQQFSLSVGMDFSSGDYGLAKNTDIFYLPSTLKYEQFPWRVAFTIPYIRITGPGGVIGGGYGGVITGGDSNGRGDPGESQGGNKRNNRGRTTEQGLGDMVASLSYALDPLWNLPLAVDMITKVKFATADEEKELGTGENDYAVQLDIASNHGRFSPFATLGYRFMGDPPDLDLNNVWFFSLGFDRRLSESFSGGMSFDYRQAISPGAAEMQELVAYLNRKLDNSWSINGYGVLGFSDASPDVAVGIQLTYMY